jgi:hypothetical protein
MEQQEKKELFMELFNEFYKKCLEHDVVPVAVMRQSPFEIKADFDFMEVTKEQKKELMKKLSQDSKLVL